MMRDDWVEVKLQDLTENPKTDIVDGPFGSNLKAGEYVDQGVPVFKIQNIKANHFVNKDIKFVTAKKAETLDRHSFSAGDLIITKLGNPLGLCCEVPKEYPYGIIVADLLRFRPDENLVDKKYLRYCINSSVIQSLLKEITKGTTRPRVNLTIVRGLPLKIPSILEQRAIVKKIEELFSDLDKGISDLKKAQEQLKVYRQAVLKKAFEESASTENKNIFDIVEKIQIGPFGSQLHKKDYISNGIPLINPMHIHKGKIIPNPTYSISEDKRDSLPNYILQEDDVIMGRRGEMGRCGLVSKKEVGWFCGTGSLYLRPNKDIVYAPFLFYYMRSSTVKEFLTGSAKGTTMKNLNKKIVSNIPINLPKSVNEQCKIVQEIESRLSVCDQVEQNINDSLQKCEALRQSILKKAFEGNLLNESELDQCKQADDYEPAQVLLERIKAEKN